MSKRTNMTLMVFIVNLFTDRRRPYLTWPPVRETLFYPDQIGPFAENWP